MNDFISVDEYIDACTPQHQPLLQELRRLIISFTPVETVETISYKMPTYRHNGNLIHFALFKNHLSIFPGSEAIEHFSQELKTYTTSKGSIHLNLDKPLPQQLIKEIIEFNIELLNAKKKPSWEKYRDQWPEAYEIMQQLIQQTDLKRELKWGTDIYTFNGKNVIGWNGFKDFFALWFYVGVFLEDKDKVLVSASEGKTKSLRQWRFTNAKQMNTAKILAYINESIKCIQEGKEIKPEKRQLKEPSAHFKLFLQENDTLKLAFEKLSPGKQKDYIEYIEEAKQEKTKLSRLEKIKPMILDGKGLNDKYKK